MYWLTQINEILIVLALIIALWFGGSASYDQTYNTRLIRSIVVLIVAFVLNRIWVRTSRESTRRATEEEIEAIHADHGADFESRLRDICREYGVLYA